MLIEHHPVPRALKKLGHSNGVLRTCMPDLIEIVSLHLGTIRRQGKTYHAPCPACQEGSDRFVIWPPCTEKPTGTFYCRRCRIAGDGIDFCRKFLGVTFSEACNLLNSDKHLAIDRDPHVSSSKPAFSLHQNPSHVWQQQAERIIDLGTQDLRTNQTGQKLIQKRQITSITAERFGIGYNPITRWESMEAWGLQKEVNDSGKERKIWLPRGLIIPRRDPVKNSAIGIKIRRDEWCEDDTFPKYVEVKGGVNAVGIYGDSNHKIAVVMESELDAIILQQQAGDLCFSVSLGGAGTKRMDLFTYHLLSRCSLVLLATDYDDAGLREMQWWKENLPKAEYWPAPSGKSPGESHEQGVDLSVWVKCAIRKYSVQEESIL